MILWTSGMVPGKAHDLTAARIWGIPRELEKAGILTLVDQGYQGMGGAVVTSNLTGCRAANLWPRPGSEHGVQRPKSIGQPAP